MSNYLSFKVEETESEKRPQNAFTIWLCKFLNMWVYVGEVNLSLGASTN